MHENEITRPDERLALNLMQVIRADAEAACAPNTVEMVSVTFDVSSAASSATDVTLSSTIDRRTRTILFTGGTAAEGDKVLMKATAVYRILSAD